MGANPILMSALILGGVGIEHSHGLHGHSDGDALTHAICDALLGALALGDLDRDLTFSPLTPWGAFRSDSKMRVSTNSGHNTDTPTPLPSAWNVKVMQKAFNSLDASVEHGKDPAIFGPLIESIISSNKVKRNYYIGSFSEKLGIKLKKFLPYYMYESILRKYFASED